MHVQNAAEKAQEIAADPGFLWNPDANDAKCMFCLSRWYDASTGVNVVCKTCKEGFHQECHTAVPILTDVFRANDWECAWCSGADPDVCDFCNKGWTDSLKKNSLSTVL